MVALRIAITAVAAMVVAPLTAHAHPIHMSVTEVRFAQRTSVDITVKVFADDFSTAAARYTRSHIDSGKVIDRTRGFAYLMSRVRLGNRAGSIPLRPCGVTEAGETLLFCLRADVVGDAGSLKLSNGLMTDLFSDQVNVVQTTAGKKRSSRMFVRGDGWKSLI